MTVSARSSGRPDPPFKDVYTSQNPKKSTRTSSTYRQPSQENPNGVSYGYSETPTMHHDRVRTRAMRNVSLLDDTNQRSSQTSIPSRHLNTPALRQTGDPHITQITRSISRQRASSLDPRSMKTKPNATMSKAKSAESQIKSLQKELDEVKFFREIEETDMEARKARQRSGIPQPTHHQQQRGPTMQNRLYENELEIKTLDLKLKSSHDDNVKLTKKLKIYKDTQEQKRNLEEKIKVIEKLNRVGKKENVSLEEKIRELEKTVDKQKQELRQKSKVDQKLRKKEGEIETLQKDLQKQKKNNKTLDKQINDCIDTIEVAEAQLSKSRKDISELKTQKEDLQHLLDDQRTDLEKKENCYDEKNDEALDLQAKIDQLSGELLHVMGLLEEKQKECAGKEDELHTLAEEAEANNQHVEGTQEALTEVKASNEILLFEIKEKDKEKVDLNEKLQEVKSLLLTKDYDLETKEIALKEKNRVLSNLEDRYNDTKELLESNRLILELHNKETESLRKQILDQESKVKKNDEDKTNLETQISDVLNERRKLEETLEQKEKELKSNGCDHNEKIEELTEKIAKLEDELAKAQKSKDELLSLHQGKWEKIESDLLQSLTDKQNEFSELEDKLFKEKVEKEFSQNKYNKEVPELQKKLDDATQKLIDTMSSSLANGRELEEYRSKVSSSEAENEEEIDKLRHSLDEANEELAKSKQTIEQYNLVSEKLCVEIEESKYHHDLEIEELEDSIETLKSELEMQQTHNSNEARLELSQMKEKHTHHIKKLESQIEEFRISVKKERSRNADMDSESDSLEVIFRSLRSKFSSILSNYKVEPISSLKSERSYHQPLTFRLNELSDSVVTTFQKIEQELSALRRDTQAKEENIKKNEKSHELEISTLKQRISDYAADLAKGRVVTNSFQNKENELRKSLLEERDKLKNAMSEIETVTEISQKNSDQFASMKARSDAHITALHTALEDAKADIAQLENMVQISSSSQDRSVSSRSVSSNEDLGSVARRLRAERLSSDRGRDSLRGTRNHYMRKNIGISRREASTSRIRNFNNYSHNFEHNNFSLDNLGTSTNEYPDPGDEFDEISHNSSDVENIELDALAEFMSLRTQRNNEI